MCCMQVTPKRCKGCKCIKCRWRGAGSNCCYNEHGVESSRCSHCQVYARGEGLAAMKTESYLCEGYQRKYEAKEALEDGKDD